MRNAKFDPLVVGYVIQLDDSYMRFKDDGNLGFALYRNKAEAQRMAYGALSRYYGNMAAGRVTAKPGEAPLPVKFDEHSQKFVVCTLEGKPTKQYIQKDAVNLISGNGPDPMNHGSRVELTEVREDGELKGLYVVRDGVIQSKAEGDEAIAKQGMLAEMAAIVASAAETKVVKNYLSVPVGSSLGVARETAQKGSPSMAPELKPELYLGLTNESGDHKLELHESEVGWHLVDTAATPPWKGELWAEKAEVSRAEAVAALAEVQEHHASFTGVLFKEKNDFTISVHKNNKPTHQ